MLKRIPILDCVPGSFELRNQQGQSLKFIEENYDSKKFIFVDAPTGAGKSLIVATFNTWISQNNLGKCADTVRNKMLQDQYTKDFDWIPDLKGQDSYHCKLIGKSCADYKRYGPTGKLCGGTCSYMAAKACAETANTAIFNFHSYYYNEMWNHKDHLVIDECHNLPKFLEDLYTIELWSCEFNFDSSQGTESEALQELVGKATAQVNRELVDLKARRIDSDISKELEELAKRLENIAIGLQVFGKDILVTKKSEVYKKKRWLKRDMSKFKDTFQTIIRIKPLRVDGIAKTSLWMPEIKKVLLLSGTIDESDAEDLGIGKDEYVRIKTDNPIDPERRKFIVWPIANMSYKYQQESLPKATKAIQTIADKNKDAKGLVHCTYGLSKELLKHFGGNSRYLFHTESNKDEIYHKFRNSKEPLILVACGMSEGIDLPDDYARWQIILKVQYPSLGDEVWAWKCQNRPRAYSWETMKTIIQQAGRICRGATDKGFTYMIDSEYLNLEAKIERNWPEMIPDWFKKAKVKVKV